MSETTTLGTGSAEAMWKLGYVVEDRWGLRWRADAPASGRNFGVNGWQCRSVGLRIFRSHDEMDKRGPLTFIRHDRVMAGEEAATARKDGATQDEAVTVSGADSEDA